jgi:hypothetical protein
MDGFGHDISFIVVSLRCILCTYVFQLLVDCMQFLELRLAHALTETSSKFLIHITNVIAAPSSHASSPSAAHYGMPGAHLQHDTRRTVVQWLSAD